MKNWLVRFRKECSTDEGADTRENHHDPENPAPPKMANSDATEKMIRHPCAPHSHQDLLATDNWSDYWPQEYIHRKYACRNAASGWVPYIGNYSATGCQWCAGKESGEKPRDDDGFHILR